MLMKNNDQPIFKIDAFKFATSTVLFSVSKSHISIFTFSQKLTSK